MSEFSKIKNVFEKRNVAKSGITNELSRVEHWDRLSLEVTHEMPTKQAELLLAEVRALPFIGFAISVNL